MWSERRQAVLSSVFYVTSTLSMLLSGWLAERFGAKKLLGVAMATLSLSSLLMPVSADVHYFLLVLLRVMAGAGVVGVSSGRGQELWAPGVYHTE